MAPRADREGYALPGHPATSRFSIGRTLIGKPPIAEPGTEILAEAAIER